MKKLLLFLLITSLLFLSSCSNEKICSVDEDCKLIYNDCGCKAVNVNFTGKLEESKILCEINSCRVSGYKAICFQNKCVMELNAGSGQKNPEICEELIDSKIKDRCYYNVALEIKNVKICDNILGQEQKDDCIYQVAAYTRDGTLCERIITPRIKNDCDNNEYLHSK